MSAAAAPRVAALPGERPLAVAGSEAPAVVATPFVWRDPSTIPVRQWLYGRHAIRKFMSVTVAPGGIGKSTNALAEAIALCTGKNILYDQVGPRTASWYCGLEDPRQEYERRIAAVVLHHELDHREVASGLFLDSSRDQRFIVATEGDRGRGTIIHYPVVDAVKATIRANDIGFLVVDPFVGSHEVSENDNGKIAAVARLWADIADTTGCAVELIHHSRKIGLGQGEASADDARGASALVNASRSTRILVAMTDQQAAEAKTEERRRYFQIVNGKANLTLGSTTGIWRELATVSLGNGNGGPDDEVGVARRWLYPTALDGLTVSDLDRVQARLRSEGRKRADKRADDWVGLLVGEVLGLDPDDEGDRIDKVIRTWTKSGALKKVYAVDPKARKRKPFIEAGGAAP